MSLVLAGIGLGVVTLLAGGRGKKAKKGTNTSKEGPVAGQGSATGMEQLDGLEDGFRERVRALIATLVAEGWQVHVFYGHRTMAQQKAVSNAEISFHNMLDEHGEPEALAVDLADKRYGWGAAKDGSQDPAKTAEAAKFFRRLGYHAKRLGLHWGGDWSATNVWKEFKTEEGKRMGWDPAHVQALPNEQIAMVRERLRSLGVTRA